MFLGIEVVGVRRERRARGVLDALVDGQDRDVAGAGEPAVRRTASAASAAPASGGPSRSTTRSTKSGPGRWRRSRGIVVHSWPSRSSASSPRIDSMRPMPLAELVMAMSDRVPSRRSRRALGTPRLARPASAGRRRERDRGTGSFYLGKPYDVDEQEAGRRLRPLRLEGPVTHAVCVGMTGRGKTGLCLGAARRGRHRRHPRDRHRSEGRPRQPAADVSRALRPEDFRPWINEDDAAQGGVSPDDFAEDAGRAVEEGPRRLGPGRRAHPAAARRGRLRHLHARQQRRPTGLDPRLVRPAGRPLRRPEALRRSDQHHGDQPARRCSASTPIRSRAASTSSSRRILGTAWKQRQGRSTSRR